jgi:hypothetical protein
MSFLTEIVAGGLAIVAAIMRNFVTVSESSPGSCNIVTVRADLTDCGESLVDQLITLIYSGIAMVTDLVQALAAVPMS